MRTSARRFAISAAVVVALGTAGRAGAQQAVQLDSLGGGGGESAVRQFEGEYTDGFAIKVPGFHGIEPKLELAYDSSARNGFVGVGWSLQGLSVIERVNAGLGSPNFNGADHFLLDGEPLIACASGSLSPSCANGGNYSAQVETYERIAADSTVLAGNATNYTESASGPKWTVTAKDGTRSVYIPIYEVPISGSWYVWKWGLSTVTDPQGNRVTYNWGNNLFACCWAYPASVTYNGTTVTFNWQQRGDVYTRGNGNGLESYEGLIKSIDVTVGGACAAGAACGTRARAYKLSYGSSPASGRALLTSLQEYGKDAVLDSTGAITGGSAEPATAFGYTGAGGSFAMYHVANEVGSWLSPMIVLPGDFNGDGITDVLKLWNDAGGITADVYISNGTSLTMQRWMTQQGGYVSGMQFAVGDFNGDGKDDVMDWWNDGGYVSADVHVSTGSAFNIQRWATQSGTYFTSGIYQFGDFNGDGKTDFLKVWNDNGGISADVSVSTGSAFNLVRYMTQQGSYLSSMQFVVGDFNGDGLSDVMDYWNDSGNITADVHVSNGSTFNNVRYMTQQGGYLGGMQFAAGDFNGDGKTDLLDWWNDNNYVDCDVHVSQGNAFELHRWATQQGYWMSGMQFFFGDFNGDGFEDMLDVFDDNGNISADVKQGTGTAFNQIRYMTQQGGWVVSTQSQAFMVGDFNGDGLDDLSDYWNYSGYFMDDVHRSMGGSPDLLSQVANGLGGTVSIQYRPSTVWSNQNVIPLTQTVTQVTSSDGRGWSSTVGYWYSGGLYDWLDHRFLGFHYVKKTLPALAGESAGPYEETWFDQNYGSLSFPDEERYSTGSGVLLNDAVYDYVTNGSTQPYMALQTSEWKYTYDGSGNACSSWPCAYGKRTYTSRTYDNYNGSSWSVGFANPLAEYDYGDYDVSGDEKTAVNTYYANGSAYLVSSAAVNAEYAGIGTSGTLLHQTLMYYDGATAYTTAPTLGEVTEKQEWVDQSNSYVTATMAYDSYGNEISSTDPLGNKASFTFDPTYHVYQTASTNPLGQTGSQTWDPLCGEQTQAVSLNGQAANRSYDALCRITQSTGSLGAFSYTYYVNIGNPSTQYIEVDTPSADGNGNQWVQTYFDGLGRTWQTLAKGPSTLYTQTQYDARGNVSQTTLPYYSGGTQYWTTTSYDALNRVTRVAYPDGAAITHSYAPVWTSVTVDEAGHQTKNVDDAWGRRVQRSELHNGAWSTINYTYNARGALIQTTDPAGNVTTYTVDSLGRRTQEVDPDLGTRSWAYDADGHMTSQTDALGQQTTLTVDALGRLTSRTANAGTASASTVSWRFDEARSGYYNVGRVTTTTDASGTRTDNYDAAGNLVQSTRTINGVAYSITHGYDASGRTLWTTFPDGDTVGTSASPVKYDAAGRLSSIPGIVTSFQYDANGRITSQANANGTSTTFTVSPQRGWVTAIATTLPGGATEQNLAYTRDAEGQITQVTSPFASEGWTYAYDDNHELTAATNASSSTYNQTLAYDVLGDVTSNSQLGTYSYPTAGAARPHAVTAAGSNTYVYDGDGQMTSGAGRTFTWSAANLPVNVNGWLYTYDADGNRLAKTSPSGVTTTYLDDDYEIASGGQVTKYIDGPGGLVAKRVGNGTSSATYWIHSDVLGSIQALTNASGQEIWRQKYYPFGDRLETDSTANTPAGFAESRGYTGERQDETGLIYLHARYYDPKLARFTSADTDVPTSDIMGLNRYAYAGNNPITNSDPSGHMLIAFDGGGGGGGGGGYAPAPVFRPRPHPHFFRPYHPAPVHYSPPRRPYRPYNVFLARILDRERMMSGWGRPSPPRPRHPPRITLEFPGTGEMHPSHWTVPAAHRYIYNESMRTGVFGYFMLGNDTPRAVRALSDPRTAGAPVRCHSWGCHVVEQALYTSDNHVLHGHRIDAYGAPNSIGKGYQDGIHYHSHFDDPVAWADPNIGRVHDAGSAVKFMGSNLMFGAMSLWNFAAYGGFSGHDYVVDPHNPNKIKGEPTPFAWIPNGIGGLWHALTSGPSPPRHHCHLVVRHNHCYCRV